MQINLKIKSLVTLLFLITFTACSGGDNNKVTSTNVINDIYLREMWSIQMSHKRS
jgi:hypothetical protein